MEIIIERKYLKSKYTIGDLYIVENESKKWICNTLEDCVRDLNRNGQFDNDEKKVYGETAIHYGRYEVELNAKSPKYSNFAKYPWAKPYNGCLPRLKNVKNFDGILVHPGNTPSDTLGCVLVGYNTIKGQLTNSRKAFALLMDKYLTPARKRGEKVCITIK